MSASSFLPLADDGQGRTLAVPSEESVLRIGTMQVVDSLNPNVYLTDIAHLVGSLMYDSLFAVDEDIETVGNLALDWRIVPENDPELISSGEPYGSVWEYNITHNAKWHDGEPLTIDDIVWTVNLNADYYDMMWAYQPYAYFMDYAESVDSDTLRIHFYDRDSGSPMPVAYGDQLFIPILPKHKLQAYPASYISFTWGGFFGGEEYPVVGTGPFTATAEVVDEMAAGDQLTLVRNPDYHWADDWGMEVQLDKVVIYFYDDDTAMRLALSMGMIDVAQFPPQSYLALESDVMSGSVDDVHCQEGLRVNQYWTEVLFNMNEDGPNCARLDPAVRQALAMATNKTYITENFYFSLSQPGSTLISPMYEEWHYEPTAEEMFVYDLDAAEQLLEDSGYRYTVTSPTVRVATADSLAVQEGYVEEGTQLVFDMLVRREYPEERDIAQYLDYVWAEIGVDIQYIVLDEVTLSTYVYGYAYDTAIWYWSSDPDPNYMLFCQSSYSWGGWSDNAYSNTDYDVNYTASVGELDPEMRKLYVDNCQRIHYLDSPYIILAYPYQAYAWRTDTFAGWGDWDAHPGRSLDAYWGAHPLLFDLVPITEDNEAPASLGIELPDGDVYAPAEVQITLTAEDADSDDLIVTLEFGDGTMETLVMTGSSTSYEATVTHTYDSPGEYELNMTADDQTEIYGHNVSFGPVALTVLEDDVAPVVVVDLEGDEGEDGWFVSAVMVSMSATDVGGAVDSLDWKLNGGSWATYEGPFNVSSQGANQLNYSVCDSCGNYANGSVEIPIDTSPPAVAIGVDESHTSSTVTVVLEWNDAASGVVRVEVSLDGGPAADVDMSNMVVFDEVEDGAHTVRVTVYDAAGHSSFATATFDVETSVFALDGPMGPWAVIAVVIAVLAVAGVTTVLIYRRMKSPKT